MADEVDNLNLKKRVNERFRQSPLVADFFPLKLKNGAIVKKLIPRCSACNKEIVPGFFHGDVRTAPEDCHRITAIGFCVACDLMSPFLCHIVPKGDEGFELHELSPRGWPELYTPQVVPFAKKKTRADRKKKTVCS